MARRLDAAKLSAAPAGSLPSAREKTTGRADVRPAPPRSSRDYIGLFSSVLQPAWTAAPFLPPPVMSVGVYSQRISP